MDKMKIDRIQAKVTAFFKTIEDEFKIKVFTNGGRYTPNEATLKYRFMDVGADEASASAVVEAKKPDEVEGLRLFPNLIGTTIQFERFGRVTFSGYNRRHTRYPYIFSILSKPGRRMKCDAEQFARKLMLNPVTPKDGSSFSLYEQELLNLVADKKIESV